jgi:NAD(P)-dependent dehydrogenase (short-subunit alcohol dehydrogenase family)
MSKAVPRAKQDIVIENAELRGRTVLLIGGSAGIGLAAARRARSAGAEIILTGRNASRLAAAAADLDTRHFAAFDANDPDALAGFFRGLDRPIDHILVTAGGPSYKPMLQMNAQEVREALSGHALLGLEVARHAQSVVPPAGSLTLMGGTGGRRIDHRVGIVSAATALLPAFTAALALELAPIRVNLIAAGFVDTPLSASLLGSKLDERRAELQQKLPIGRVVTAEDVAALALHLMVNTALTGATYDIDGGQQYV